MKDEKKAYMALLRMGYALPPIEQCRFRRVLDCVIAVGWGHWEAMYSPVTGKTVRPYRV